MKKFLIIPILICILFFLIGCKPYNSDDFIGLSSQQIVEEFGEFDRYSFWDSTKNYRTGVYIVKPKRVGFFGTYNEEYFVIRFDKKGFAYECEYVIGGAGG